MNNFWQELEKPFFVLAPMEAVTDRVFRHVVAKAAPPDVWFTEFTNATGWAAAGERAIGSRLVKTDDEKPIVAQLWGARPEAMAALARHCAELGYGGIDLNTGCPDSAAVKSGGGAAMIKDPALTAEMIAACKESGLPVSVKTRLGYSRLDEHEAWLTHLLEQDIVALTVHLRTKKEMSKVDAHWELMSDIVALRDSVAPGTLIIGNGDVKDRAHGLKLASETGVDGLMIGRGIFHDPFAFAKETPDSPAALLDPSPEDGSIGEAQRASASEALPPKDDDRKETVRRELLLDLLHYHLDLYDAWSDRPFDTLKRFFKIYVRDFPEASSLRDKLMHTKTTEEVRDILGSLKS